MQVKCRLIGSRKVDSRAEGRLPRGGGTVNDQPVRRVREWLPGKGGWAVGSAAIMQSWSPCWLGVCLGGQRYQCRRGSGCECGATTTLPTSSGVTFASRRVSLGLGRHPIIPYSNPATRCSQHSTAYPRARYIFLVSLLTHPFLPSVHTTPPTHHALSCSAISRCPRRAHPLARLLLTLPHPRRARQAPGAHRCRPRPPELGHCECEQAGLCEPERGSSAPESDSATACEGSGQLPKGRLRRRTAANTLPSPRRSTRSRTLAPTFSLPTTRSRAETTSSTPTTMSSSTSLARSRPSLSATTFPS